MDWESLKEKIHHFWQKAKKEEFQKAPRLVCRLVGRETLASLEKVILWTEEREKLFPKSPYFFSQGDRVEVEGIFGVLHSTSPRHSTLEVLLEKPLFRPLGAILEIRATNFFYLYEQKEKLWQDISKSSSKALLFVKNLLLGKKFSLPKVCPSPLSLSFPVSLDESQQKALECMCHTPDFWLVWGAPGTGKTTLAALFLKLIRDQGKTILLTSTQHVALDQVLLQLFRFFPSLREETLRLGPLSKIAKEIEDVHLFYRGEVEISSYPLVVSTLSGCASSLLWESQFDIVVLDEAARASLPLSLLGLSKAKERFYLLGDPLQLRPIVPKGVEAWQTLSLFEMALCEEEIQKKRLSCLTRNYRSEKRLVQVLSTLYKERGHKDLQGGQKASLSLPFLPSSSLVYIPKTFSDSRWYLFGGERSLASPWEAACTFEVVQCLLPYVSYQDLWLLSPFRLQAFLLERMFRKKANRHFVNTIDQSQGGERKVVVLSLVADRKRTVQTKLSLERLNVALSRAKEKLILIGHVELLLESPSLFSFVEALLDEGEEWSFSPSPTSLEKAEKKLFQIRQISPKKRKKENIWEELQRIPCKERDFLDWIPKISQRRW